MTLGVHVGGEDVGSEPMQGTRDLGQQPNLITSLDLNAPAPLANIHDAAYGTPVRKTGVVGSRDRRGQRTA